METNTRDRWAKMGHTVPSERAGRMSQAFWQAPRATSWAQAYADSAGRPSRGPLRAALLSVAPFETVLDLGCNAGVLVPLLEVVSPGVRVTGVDVNVGALEFAMKAWPRQRWVWGRVQDVLREMPTAGFDVVVAGSCLSLVAPHEIDEVLADVCRVARVAAVFQEPVAGAADDEGLTPSGCPEWRYDYPRRMQGWKVVEQQVYEEYSEPGRPSGIVLARQAAGFHRVAVVVPDAPGVLEVE